MTSVLSRGAVVAAVAVAVLLAAVPATVADDGWILLGERVVLDRVDRDVIVVTAARGQLSALQVRVLRRPVRFLDMTVHFANGGKQDVPLRAVIPAGGSSRVIDLVGDDRVVTKVEFTYEAESIGRGKRSTVRLWGRR